MTTATSEDINMSREMRELLAILRKHPGKLKAIHLAPLYEEWSGNELLRSAEGKILDDVPTLSRKMREMINVLIDVHGIPVMSSSSLGYWIIADESEMQEVYHEFAARGLFSLQKAARLTKISLVDAVHQLALDLQDGNSDIRRHISAKRVTKAPKLDLLLSPEARMAAVTKSLQEILDDPETYAAQIKALQTQFGPRLMPKELMDRIQQQMASVKQLNAAMNRSTSDLERLLS